MRGTVIFGSTTKGEISSLSVGDFVSRERAFVLDSLFSHILSHGGTFPSHRKYGTHAMTKDFHEFWGFSLDLLRLQGSIKEIRANNKQSVANAKVKELLDRENKMRVVLRVVWKDINNCKASGLGISMEEAEKDSRFPKLMEWVRAADAPDIDFFIHIWAVGIDYHDPHVSLNRSRDTNSFLSVIMDYL